MFCLDAIRGAIAEPFPHAVIDDALPQEVLAQLRAEFPDEDDFARSATIMGGRQNLIRGNPHFPVFLSRRPAWRKLFEQVNSRAFVGAVLQLFRDSLRVHGLAHQAWQFEDYVEEAGAASTVGMADAGSQESSSRQPAGAPPTYYVTFDIARATTGYERGPHLDARYKLASMLYFLNSPADYSGVGAQFGMHRLREGSRPAVARFPAREEVSDVSYVSPHANRAVIFLNSPSALHSVSKLDACSGHRHFLYIGVAARHVDDLWRVA